MPSTLFRRSDMRFFASALANNATHGGISTFELGIGITTEGNKGERASLVIKTIMSEEHTDALLLELLNFLYVENPYADTSSSNTAYDQLRTNVLDPLGVTLTSNGYALPDGRDVDALQAEARNGRESSRVHSPAPAPANPVHSASSTSELMTVTDTNKVFLVHGRDLRPVIVLEQFLLYLGLHLISWPEAVALTGRSQPHTIDVVKAGLANASAVIVLFSPDDEARLKKEFSHGPGDSDIRLVGQARQNVLLEAGMAFALAPEKTIFVKSAQTREISDIAGFNWVKMDGAWQSRQDLKNRLATARAAVRTGEYDLTASAAGPFQVS